jgi:peroxiredoxin Q/BCP
MDDQATDRGRKTKVVRFTEYLKLAKWAVTRREGTMLNVGDPAPDFAVPDQDRKIQRLSDYLGKRVVLWFYPKADTPG